MKRTKLSRVRKTPLAKMKREADKLAGEKCRARGICESCGSIQNLQWCHIISRRLQVLRWRMDNCLCLCRECHARFTYQPRLWTQWIIDNISEQYSKLNVLSLQLTKIDRAFMEKVLEELK